MNKAIGSAFQRVYCDEYGCGPISGDGPLQRQVHFLCASKCVLTELADACATATLGSEVGVNPPRIGEILESIHANDSEDMKLR